MTRIHHWLIVLLAILAFTQPAPLAAARLRAGVARVDLTPPLEIKASLGGYGERMSRPAEGIHDRVFAKALVLTDGTRKFTIVTADILGFPPSFKKAVVEQLAPDAWAAEQILLLPSHAHTSIDMMQIHPGNKLSIPQLGLFHKALYERTVARLVSVIRAADKNQVPVRVGTRCRQLTGWNVNRRHANGPVDRQLTVTRVDAVSGQPVAVLVNWTAHPTFMSADDMWYSGGWPGHLQRTLESLIGGKVTALYYNGAEGDQRPLARPDSGTSHWERAERYGRELAIETKQLYDDIRPREDVPFEFRNTPVALPTRTAHPQFMSTGGAEYGLTKKLAGQLLTTVFPAETHSIQVRVGELVVVGVPGELAAELGLEVKRRVAMSTGAACPTVGGLADEWISYILPEAEYRQGGYEASVSFYGPTLGRTIVDAITRRVKP